MIEFKRKGDKLLTGEMRLSFPCIFQRSLYQGVEGKYSVELLFPKKNKELAKTILIMATEAARRGPKNKTWSEKTVKAVIAELKTRILKDGDAKTREDGTPYDGYPGHYWIKANNDTQPQVVAADGVTMITRREDVYAGCYVQISLTFFAYDQRGNRGVGLSLGNVQKIRDGEPFGNRSSAQDDFDSVESDDLENDDIGESDDLDDFDL